MPGQRDGHGDAHMVTHSAGNRGTCASGIAVREDIGSRCSEIVICRGLHVAILAVTRAQIQAALITRGACRIQSDDFPRHHRKLPLPLAELWGCLVEDLFKGACNLIISPGTVSTLRRILMPCTCTARTEAFATVQARKVLCHLISSERCAAREAVELPDGLWPGQLD